MLCLAARHSCAMPPALGVSAIRGASASPVGKNGIEHVSAMHSPVIYRVDAHAAGDEPPR